MMNADEAENALADTEVVPCLQATIADAKEIRAACLEADIPVLLGREDACCAKTGACGCAPKLQLLARAEDAPRIARLMQDRWRAMALAEGTVDQDHPAVAVPEGGEPPCPACGTAAALVGGACTDCGLQLE
jgi:hypothetical protein